MPITLNAAGIVFGDGTTQYSSGKLVNFQRFTYATRTSFPDTSGASGATFWTVTYNKLYPKSNLYIEIDISMRNNYSDCLTHEVQYAGSKWFQGTMPYDAGFGANSRPYHSTYYIEGVTNTGNNTLAVRYRCANNASGERPANNVWNPNSADDGRYTQEYSAIHVYEILD